MQERLIEIEDILKQLTTEEKVKLLNGASTFRSVPIERLGIPAIQYLDGGTGINWEQLIGDWASTDTGTAREVLKHFDEPDQLVPEYQEVRRRFLQKLEEKGCPEEQPSCYPPGILMGATWNPQVVHECGQALGQEALDYQVDILLGTPNVNLLRNPLNGRFFEGYSEDPYLVTALAPELVKGVQESGVLANVKHFAANNLEAYRQGIDEHISERVLQEMYYPGFRACVEQGKVKTLMSAYNKINGVACTENKELLQNTLRKEWGFGDNLVISDWGAVYHQAEAIMAGNDVDMPGPRNQDAVFAALEQGILTQEALDEAVRHMLQAVLQSPAANRGIVKKADTKTRKEKSEFQKQAAYRAITEGAVLLKNSEGALPILKESKIAFIGKETAKFHDCGDGSARVVTNKTTSLWKEFAADTDYESAYFEQIRENDLKGFDYAVITVFVQGQEGRDRTSLQLPLEKQDEIKAVIKEAKKAETKVLLVLNVCGPVDLRFCEEDLDGILCIFFPGMEGGRGVKDIFTGKVNPSGKLPITFPKRSEDCPTYLCGPSTDWTINYGEGLYVGYRYYDKKDIAPLYPFGYGLSYTTFRIEEVVPVCSDEITKEDTIRICCKITNTGKFAGKEVLQLYVEDVVSSLNKPLRELKAFEKVSLESEETKEVEFCLPAQSLASFDPAFKAWEVEPGEYRFYVGTSSRCLEPPVSVIITGSSRYDFGPDTPFIRILDHPTAYTKLLDHCKKYEIMETDFQEVAVYTPYYSLERVLNEVLPHCLKGEAPEKVKEEIYELMTPYSTWK